MILIASGMGSVKIHSSGVMYWKGKSVHQLKRYKGIIFDFDGTLVDSEPLYFRANQAAFQHYGHRIDEQEYYHHWSLLGAGIQGEINRHSLEGIDIDCVRAESRCIYRQLIESESAPLFPYAKEILTQLPALGFKTVIASNTSKDLILTILSRAGFPEPPVPIIGGDGLRPKPAPDIFVAACKQLQLAERHCLVLEDTDKGVRAARAAGVPFAVIRSAHYPDYSPVDAVGKFENLKSFFDFLANAKD